MMKQHFTIIPLTEEHDEAISSKVNFQDCKYPIEYAEAILTTAPQLQMLRQFHDGALIYAELISAKVKTPITLSIETSAPCIVFGYYVSGSVLLNLPEETEHVIAVEGQNFSMYMPAGERIWPANIGESELFFFVLKTEFLQKNKADYPALEALVQKVLTADPNAFLSGLYVMSAETEKLLIQISKFKYGTKLELEQAFMEVVSALIAQHIIQITRPKQIHYKSNEEIVYAFRDLLLLEIEKPAIPVIPKLAEQFTITFSALYRLFVKKFGKSMQCFITEERMKNAHHLLRVDKLSVAEVSWRHGYSEPGTFANLFKKQYGYPPSKAKDHPEN